MAEINIRDILIEAGKRGASDVHITVGIPPKMRINGKLVTMEGYDRLMPPDTEQVADDIMDVRQNALFIKHGQYDMSFSIAGVGRYRVNLFRQRGSVAIALRLVAQEVPSTESLGIPPAVVDLYTHKRGLVLVTGPTGSGKSTTIAALIDLINNNLDRHILTLEDPIEFTYRHNKSIVNQREVGIDSESYADALRAALREDPDVLLVGEMRDLETISTAMTAAETGHLVFSTLHTIDAKATIDRIIDVFPSRQQQQIRMQLSGVIEAIVSQQLLPTADDTARVAAFEVLLGDTAVRNIIREGKTQLLDGQMQTGRSKGMITMDDAIVSLYQEKRISSETALQFAKEPDLMRRRLGIDREITESNAGVVETSKNASRLFGTLWG